MPTTTPSYSTSSSLGSLGSPGRRAGPGSNSSALLINSRTSLNPASPSPASPISILPVHYKSQRVRAQVHEPDEGFDTIRRRRQDRQRTTADKVGSSYATNSLGRMRPKSHLGTPAESSSSFDQAWNNLIERRREYKNRYKVLKEELDDVTARLERTGRRGRDVSVERRTAAPTTTTDELNDIATNVDRLMARTRLDMASLKSGGGSYGYPRSSATLTAGLLTLPRNSGVKREGEDLDQSYTSRGSPGRSRLSPLSRSTSFKHSGEVGSRGPSPGVRFRRDPSPAYLTPSMPSSRTSRDSSPRFRPSTSSSDLSSRFLPALSNLEFADSSTWTRDRGRERGRRRSSSPCEEAAEQEKNLFKNRYEKDHEKRARERAIFDKLKHASEVKEDIFSSSALDDDKKFQYACELSKDELKIVPRDSSQCLDIVKSAHVSTSIQPQFDALQDIIETDLDKIARNTRVANVTKSGQELSKISESGKGQYNVTTTLCCPDPKLCRFHELTSDLFRPKREEAQKAKVFLAVIRSPLPTWKSKEVIWLQCSKLPSPETPPTRAKAKVNLETKEFQIAQIRETPTLGCLKHFKKAPEFDQDLAQGYLAVIRPIEQSFEICLECVANIMENNRAYNAHENDLEEHNAELMIARGEHSLMNNECLSSSRTKTKLDQGDDSDVSPEKELIEDFVEGEEDFCNEEDDWEYYSDHEEELIPIQAKRINKSFGIPAGLMTRWNIWDEESDSESECSEEALDEMSPYNHDRVTTDMQSKPWIVNKLRDWLDKITNPESSLFYDLNEAYLQEHPFTGSTLPKKKTLTGSLKRSKKKVKEGFRKEPLDPDPDLSLEKHLEAHYCQGVKHGTYREVGGELDRTLFAVGHYYQGRSTESVRWKGLTGGSFLVGPVNEDNLAIGYQVYLYPDLSHCIQGEFELGKLVSGQYGHVTDLVWENGIPVPIVQLQNSDVVFTHDPSTSITISRTPFIRKSGTRNI